MKRASILAVAALLIVTGVAVADHGGMGGPGFDGGPGPEAIVGSDGTIYLTSESTSNGTTTVTVTAIRSSGVKAWTATLTGRGHLTLSGSNLIQVTEAKNTDGTFTSTLTAISTTSGSTAWTKTINGRVTSSEPFSGGTYVFVVVPATSTATRSLEALGNDGSVLWTISL